MSPRIDSLVLITRIGLGGFFTLLGVLKLAAGPGRWENLGAAMGALGIDALPVLWGLLAALAELAGGLAVLGGRHFRKATALLIFVMFVATASHLQRNSPAPLVALPIVVGAQLLALLLLGTGTRMLGWGPWRALILRRKLTTGSAALLILALVGGSMALRSKPWDATPRHVDGKLLFQEHISLAPISIYTPQESRAMAAKIDHERFVLEAMKREEIWSLMHHDEQIGVGELAPDFELRTVGGGTVRLSALRGKNVVLMFAAMTCPPARAQLPRLQALQERYAERDVEFLVVYSRERHPGEKGYPDYSYARTNAEKQLLAAQLAELTTLRVAVDDIDERVLSSYGNAPNPSYVIDPEGTIVFRSTWTDSKKLGQVLDALLAERG